MYSKNVRVGAKFAVDPYAGTQLFVSLTLLIRVGESFAFDWSKLSGLWRFESLNQRH